MYFISHGFRAKNASHLCLSPWGAGGGIECLQRFPKLRDRLELGEIGQSPSASPTTHSMRKKRRHRICVLAPGSSSWLPGGWQVLAQHSVVSLGAHAPGSATRPATLLSTLVLFRLPGLSSYFVHHTEKQAYSPLLDNPPPPRPALPQLKFQFPLTRPLS